MNTAAIRILKTVAKLDKSTANGRKAIRMQRGKFDNLFRSNSIDLRDSALRTFDRVVSSRLAK